MNTEKKLSIIVPMYNGKKRIKKCIQSIFAQSYSDMELILIDDGSKDGTYEEAQQAVEEVRKESGKESLEVTLLRHENHGVAYTRNYGISIARGEYLAFVDQDDYILPEYCATYIQKAEQEQADIVIGGYDRITDEGKVTMTVSLVPEEWSKFIVTAPWAHIYRTDFIRQNGVQFLTTGIGEDIYFNLVAYAYTEKVAILSDHSYMWVDNPKSVSNSKQNTINDVSNPMFLLNELKARLPKDNKLGNGFEEYFFMRYVVWYFSFTIRGSKREDVVRMYGELMQWLRKHYPLYRKNPNICLLRPKGDYLSIRVGVWLFYMLERIGMMPWCLKILAKK